jgi:hypothetical protein
MRHHRRRRAAEFDETAGGEAGTVLRRYVLTDTCRELSEKYERAAKDMKSAFGGKSLHRRRWPNHDTARLLGNLLTSRLRVEPHSMQETCRELAPNARMSLKVSTGRRFAIEEPPLNRPRRSFRFSGSQRERRGVCQRPSRPARLAAAGFSASPRCSSPALPCPVCARFSWGGR